MEFLAQFHPSVVHFSIAFFTLYFLFEIFGIVTKKDFLLKSSYIILFLGVIFSVASVLTGNQAYEVVKKNQIDALLYQNQIERHELFATISLWYFSALLVLRTYLIVKKKFEGRIRFLFILFGLIGIYLILLTGFYGGELVFKYGIGVKLF